MPSGLPSPASPVVVLPVFNRAVTVQQTLDAVLAQTLPPVRLVVVDDGSTDGTADAIERRLAEAQPAFPISLVRQPNHGVATARNVGLAACGDVELVAFLDSDDLWPPDFLERASAALSADPEAVAATADREFWSAEGAVSLRSGEGLGTDAARWMLEHDSGIASATVCRAAVARACGGFPEHLRTGADVAIFMRMAMAGRWLHLPGRPVRYRRNDARPVGEALHLSKAYPDRARIWAGVHRTLLDQFGDHPDFPRELSLQVIGFLAHLASRELAEAGRGGEGDVVLDEAAALRFPHPVAVSVVVSWDEVCRDHEQGRALIGEIAAQVVALRAQRDTLHGILRRLAYPMELVVVFDASSRGEADVARAVRGALAEAGSDLRLRLVPSEGRSYFAMKDHGIATATGQHVVLVDADVLPGEGWLEQLLGAFDNGRIQVVSGQLVPRPESLLGAALAAAVPMPVPVAEAPVAEVDAACAANLAAEREALPVGCFSSEPSDSRERCAGLVRALATRGLRPWANLLARATIAPPADAAALVARAALHARDEGRLCARPHPIWSALRRAAHGALAGCIRLVRYRRPLGLRWSQTAGAALLVLFHYAAYALAGTLFVLAKLIGRT